MGEGERRGCGLGNKRKTDSEKETDDVLSGHRANIK